MTCVTEDFSCLVITVAFLLKTFFTFFILTHCMPRCSSVITYLTGLQLCHFVFLLDSVYTFSVFFQIRFFRYVSILKVKQEPSFVSYAFLVVAYTTVFFLPQEFRHLHRALGEHLEQYWKDSQIESKIFIPLGSFFRLFLVYLGVPQRRSNCS